MTAVRYFAPETLAETHALIAEHGSDAKPLAGGTDLLVQVRARRVAPRVIVDLKRLPLRYVIVEPTQLRIGALATHSDLAAHPTVRSELAALASAAACVGGPALRNRGTLGGNVVNASPAADAVPPLLADDAHALAQGPRGERAIPFVELFTGYRETALAADELLTEVRVPRMSHASSSTFVKTGNRAAMIIASVNIACRLSVVGDGRVTAARLCCGSVAPTAIRIAEAERMLVGSSLDTLDLDGAARAAAEAVAPISDTRASATHRVRLIAVHTRRALASVRDELKEILERG